MIVPVIKRIYIAGPMTTSGDHLVNIRQAVAAAHAIRDMGLYPFVPQLNSFWSLIFPREYEDWMEYDLHWLRVCHAVLRLPGESRGADREVKLARDRGMPVFYALSELQRFVGEVTENDR